MCRVLRCPKPNAHVIVLQRAPLYEAAVCAEHQAQIEAGAAWTYDAVDNVIYMGTDVQAEGILKVTGGESVEGVGWLRGVEGVEPTDPVITLNVETLTGEPRDPIQLVVPKHLRRIVAWWIDRDLPQPPPVTDK